MFLATALPRAGRATATCSAARAPTLPRCAASACRCRPASPSPPRSATPTTPTARAFPAELEAEVEAALGHIAGIAGRNFGDPAKLLLVSVRSGARASMPGMMDTVLNLGLNDVTVEALAADSGDARFAYDSYRRFIQMYSDVVLGLDHEIFRGDPGGREGPPRARPRHRILGRPVAPCDRALQGRRSRKSLASLFRRTRTSSCGARSARSFRAG